MIEFNNLSFYWQCQNNYIYGIKKILLKPITVVILASHIIFKGIKKMTNSMIINKNWKRLADKNK